MRTKPAKKLKILKDKKKNKRFIVGAVLLAFLFAGLILNNVLPLMSLLTGDIAEIPLNGVQEGTQTKLVSFDDKSFQVSTPYALILNDSSSIVVMEGSKVVGTYPTKNGYNAVTLPSSSTKITYYIRTYTSGEYSSITYVKKDLTCLGGSAVVYKGFFGGLSLSTGATIDGKYVGTSLKVKLVEEEGATVDAVDDYYLYAYFGESTWFDVLRNDRGLGLDITAVSGNTGKVEVIDNKIKYTAPASGTKDIFTYTVSAGGASDIATATVHLSARPVEPVADAYASPDIVYMGYSDSPKTIYVLLNDVGGPKSLVSVKTSPQYGMATIVGDAIKYTAPNQTVSSDEFEYTAKLGANEYSAKVYISLVDDTTPPTPPTPPVTPTKTCNPACGEGYVCQDGTCVPQGTTPDPTPKTTIQAKDDGYNVQKGTSVTLKVLENDVGEELAILSVWGGKGDKLVTGGYTTIDYVAPKDVDEDSFEYKIFSKKTNEYSQAKVSIKLTSDKVEETKKEEGMMGAVKDTVSDILEYINVPATEENVNNFILIGIIIIVAIVFIKSGNK